MTSAKAPRRPASVKKPDDGPQTIDHGLILEKERSVRKRVATFCRLSSHKKENRDGPSSMVGSIPVYKEAGKQVIPLSHEKDELRWAKPPVVPLSRGEESPAACCGSSWGLPLLDAARLAARSFVSAYSSASSKMFQVK
jgi:hypothetical protein